MEKIINQIRESREQLIGIFFESKKEHEVKEEGKKQALKSKNEEVYERLWNECMELSSRESSLRCAINELGNALSNLGYRVETFWD